VEHRYLRRAWSIGAGTHIAVEITETGMLWGGLWTTVAMFHVYRAERADGLASAGGERDDVGVRARRVSAYGASGVVRLRQPDAVLRE
jgi:hypothetical protein